MLFIPHTRSIWGNCPKFIQRLRSTLVYRVDPLVHDLSHSHINMTLIIVFEFLNRFKLFISHVIPITVNTFLYINNNIKCNIKILGKYPPARSLMNHKIHQWIINITLLSKYIDSFLPWHNYCQHLRKHEWSWQNSYEICNWLKQVYKPVSLTFKPNTTRYRSKVASTRPTI